MSDLPLAEQFRAFARNPVSAIAGALLIARILDSDCDDAWVIGELRRLADLSGAVDGSTLVSFLNGHGFIGAQTYYTSENSSLEHVLKTRNGIPITLGLVVIGVAEALGLTAAGVNFPQHFLIVVDGVMVDPFRMVVIDEAEQAQWLSAQGLSREQAFPEAGPVAMVLRMLNNLRLLAMQRGDYAAALDLSGYQLLLAEDRFPFHFERIDLWLAAGVPTMAVRELDLALVLAPTPALKAQLVLRRGELEGAPANLH